MPFNINTFNSQLKNVGGISQSSKFDVTITPGGRWSWTPPDTQKFSFLCRAVTLPGLALNINQIKRYAESYDMPYVTSNINWGTVACIFMLDAKHNVQDFFKNWIDNILVPEGGPSGQIYRVHYITDYVTDVTITQYDLDGKVITSYILYDAFPIALNPVYMDWNNRDQMAELNLTFAYRNWNLSTSQFAGGSPSLPSLVPTQQQVTNLPGNVPIESFA